MKAFAVFIFLCTQISIAWSLFKIAEHQNTKDISISKYIKTFFRWIKKIITSQAAKYIFALLFFSFLLYLLWVLEVAYEKNANTALFTVHPLDNIKGRIITIIT